VGNLFQTHINAFEQSNDGPTDPQNKYPKGSDDREGERADIKIGSF
jgi:hypothetical protein